MAAVRVGENNSWWTVVHVHADYYLNSTFRSPHFLDYSTFTVHYSLLTMWYWTKVIFLIFAGAVGLWLVYEIVTFPSISRLANENPTTSSLIEYRLSQARAEGREPKKFMIWTPIEAISPNLQKAVMAGEDTRFFHHNGFDWVAIQNAWDEAVKEGEREAKEEGDYDPNDWIPPMPDFKRGASTISQQLAKNLFLTHERTLSRKLQ